MTEVSESLEAVISRFGIMVRSVAVRHRLQDSDVDEVLQEVRIRLWKADPSGEQIGAIGASYVYRTAVSAALDILRRRRARAADMTQSVDELSDFLPSQSAAHADLEASELSAAILSAVDKLPPSRRPVVRMYLNGYEREEIAELMGWTEAKTRNLLYRGLDELRERLREMGVAPGGENG